MSMSEFPMPPPMDGELGSEAVGRRSDGGGDGIRGRGGESLMSSTVRIGEDAFELELPPALAGGPSGGGGGGGGGGGRRIDGQSSIISGISGIGMGERASEVSSRIPPGPYNLNM
jgi:hypothetical protein